MMTKYFKVGAGMLLIILLSSILFLVIKSESMLASQVAKGEEEKSAPVRSKPRLSILPPGENPKLGVDSARVKMIAFVDYQCGYCKAFVQHQLPFLLEEYVEKNKVQIIFRDYPLSFHENAGLLAKAAHMMAQKNEFPQFLEKVWDIPSDADSTEIFNAFDIREDTKEDFRNIEENIKESKFLAGVAGISATPTLIINNRMLVGLRNIEELKSMIEYSMKNQIPVEKADGSCGN